MELSQLETFLAVAEERSFSRAAQRLHRTQPAVSQVIRKLEMAVGENFLTALRATVRLPPPTAAAGLRTAASGPSPRSIERA